MMLNVITTSNQDSKPKKQLHNRSTPLVLGTTNDTSNELPPSFHPSLTSSVPKTGFLAHPYMKQESFRRRHAITRLFRNLHHNVSERDLLLDFIMAGFGLLWQYMDIVVGVHHHRLPGADWTATERSMGIWAHGAEPFALHWEWSD